MDADASCAVLDGTHLLDEADALPQQGGDGVGRAGRARAEAAVLGAAAGLHQLLEAAGRCDAEQHVEERDLVRLRAPQSVNGEVQPAPGVGVVGLGAEEGVCGPGVPLREAGRAPRPVGVHRTGEFVQDSRDADVFGDAGPVGGCGTGVGDRAAVVPHLGVAALLPGRERPAPEACGQFEQARLRGAHPLATVVQWDAVRAGLGQHPPADPVGRLDQGEVGVGVVESESDGQSRVPRAHHDDLGFDQMLCAPSLHGPRGGGNTDGPVNGCGRGCRPRLSARVHTARPPPRDGPVCVHRRRELSHGFALHDS